MKSMTSVCWALPWLLLRRRTPPRRKHATITGRVVDARSRQALVRVVVHVEHQIDVC